MQSSEHALVYWIGKRDSPRSTYGAGICWAAIKNPIRLSDGRNKDGGLTLMGGLHSPLVLVAVGDSLVGKVLDRGVVVADGGCGERR